MDLRFISSVCLVAAVLAASGSSIATNGYSPTGFGTVNKGMAGAGVALPQDALAGATNPAGNFFVGERMDIGAALFAPTRGFTADNNAAPSPPPSSIPPGSYESDNDLFLIPHFGWNTQIDEESTIGVLVGANGGLNTEYGTDVWRNFNNPDGTASSPTGVDFAQLFLGVPYARQLTEQHVLGVMPILAVQRFKAQGLEPFQAFSISPNYVTNNGYDYSWGYGLRVGWLGQFTDRLAIGASAQSRLYMTEFDDYRGLFAEQGDFDIPPTVTAGLSFNVAPDLTLVADWQRIFFGDVKALSNPNSGFANLGANDGLGFGWKDINIYKLGLQWEYSPKLTWRAGVSHADQLFDNAEALFNILAPATVRTHASLGATYRLDSSNNISFSFTHAFNERIDGQNPTFTGPQTGSVEMYQNELEISWTRFFN